MTSDTAQPYLLHVLMRVPMAEFDVQDAAHWLGSVRAALDAGALPDEADEHDMTPLAILVDNGINKTSAFNDAARLLVARGANPLTNDRALGKACQSAAIGPDGGLAGAILGAVIQQEAAGRALRSETGENALHVMCADAPEAVWKFIEESANPGLGGDRIPAAWYQGRDDEGRTPLHAMWSENGVIYDRLDADMDVDNEADAWVSTEAMVGQGADLLARDNERETVANRILACVEMGMPTDNADLWPQVEALATRERLERDTSAVPGRPGKLGRL